MKNFAKFMVVMLAFTAMLTSCSKESSEKQGFVQENRRDFQVVQGSQT